MDINNLKAFIEVADKKSFSRSAQSLKLTQPAVSKRIAALESELSEKLFDRVGRQVQLTEAGRLLLPSARQINRELLRIEDVICNLGKAVSGTLSIGTTEFIGNQHLPDVLQMFRRNYPSVDINLRFANHPTETLQDVAEGQLELALCLCSRSDFLKFSSKLERTEVWSENMVVVVANNHSLVKEQTEHEQKISLETLTSSRSIQPHGYTWTRRAIEKILQAHNQTLSVSVEATNFETIKKMASLGLGWACLPKHLVDSSLTVLSVEELNITYSIQLITHRERTMSRAAEAFIHTLRLTDDEPFS